MNNLAPRIQARLFVFLACLGFLIAGWALLPYNGIEADEALVGGPIFGGVQRDFRIRVFHHDIPLMLMDYVGALKSWLYGPIFWIFKPSPVSLRLPVLLIGAVTIWLVYRLLHQVAGLRAALAGCFLLATDTTFLLTTEFDWGPVAIQHLMLVVACLLLVRFAHTGSGKLFGGFLALGLGLWDKALFAWILVGLGVAAVAIFPRELARNGTARNLNVALAGFLLGAWPLLVFNMRHDWRTIRGNASFSIENIAQKAEVLKRTIDGSSLFGYMVNDPSSVPPKEPKTWSERASIRTAASTGERQQNFLLPALLLALLTAPLWGASRRAILFALIFMAVTWIQMALTRNAGGSVHHAVLLWPAPQFVIALALAEASRRWVRWGGLMLGVVIAFLCITNLLLTNQYLSQFIRYGPTVTWTDAIYPLSDSLNDETREVMVMDWDIFDQLLLLHQGGANLRVGFYTTPGEPARHMFENLLAGQRAVFVTHPPELQFFPIANQMLETAASAGGYRKELRTVADSHGRVVFEVYRFLKE